MKSKLIVMCGLQASGKSTQAKWIQHGLEGTFPGMKTVILSSDEIRKENPELANDKVFRKLYTDMNYWLRQGDNVIIDATNITIKSRKQIFLNLKEDCEKICYIMNVPYNTCRIRLIERNKTDERQVPLEALERYYKSFEIPFFYEGWDDIKFYNEIESKASYDNLMCYLTAANGFNQRNKHHTQDLGAHMEFVGKTLSKLTDNKILIDAGFCHDIGKLSTQTVGEDGNCHYYNHDSVGAYNLMCCCAIYDLLNQFDLKATLVWLFYINYHMRLHQVETEKSIKKWKSIFGEELYNDLRLFEKADKMRPELED